MYCTDHEAVYVDITGPDYELLVQPVVAYQDGVSKTRVKGEQTAVDPNSKASRL